MRAKTRRPLSSVQALKLNALGIVLQPGQIEELAQPHSGPQGITHRAVAPLAAGNAWLQAAATVARAFIYGGKGDRLEFLHQLRKAQGQRLVDIPFDLQLPVFQVDSVRNTVEVPADVEGFVRCKSGAEIMARSFQLNGPVGEQN